MPTNDANEPGLIGKPHPPSDGATPGSERARDEQREGGGPRYGGEAWDVADERGDRRFGVARNDDADPSELAKGEGADDNDGWPGDDAVPQKSDDALDAQATERLGAVDGAEHSGQRAGMGRGEKPQKPNTRAK